MAYNTLSPIRQQPYYAKSGMGLVKKKEEDESSHSTATAEAREEEHQHQAKLDLNDKKSGYEQFKESKLSNKVATASRDANLKNSAVNIAQILKDFRNTAKAIGASPELTEEVNDYLALVEKQVTKENPDTKIVRSTLKNASLLLDNYIAETLQRPSNVVENWIE